MGQSSAETVKEIEQVRAGLDDKVHELQERLPAPAVWTKRLAGAATGGGVGGTLFWLVVRRARRRRAQRQPVPAVVQLVPERVTAMFENGEWKPFAFAAGGVWLAVRLAELRQLRRTNKALMTQRAA
jgi:hypothetical protein